MKKMICYMTLLCLLLLSGCGAETVTEPPTGAEDVTETTAALTDPTDPTERVKEFP